MYMNSTIEKDILKAILKAIRSDLDFKAQSILADNEHYLSIRSLTL